MKLTEDDKKRISPALQQKMKAEDSRTIVKINGHEVLMKDFMANPKYYNSLPFKEKSAEEVLLECKTNLEDKSRLARPLDYVNYKQDT
jgi:hypothetical protein